MTDIKRNTHTHIIVKPFTAPPRNYEISKKKKRDPVFQKYFFNVHIVIRLVIQLTESFVLIMLLKCNIQQKLSINGCRIHHIRIIVIFDDKFDYHINICL